MLIFYLIRMTHFKVDTAKFIRLSPSSVFARTLESFRLVSGLFDGNEYQIQNVKNVSDYEVFWRTESWQILELSQVTRSVPRSTSMHCCVRNYKPSSPIPVLPDVAMSQIVSFLSIQELYQTWLVCLFQYSFQYSVSRVMNLILKKQKNRNSRFHRMTPNYFSTLNYQTVNSIFKVFAKIEFFALTRRRSYNRQKTLLINGTWH